MYKKILSALLAAVLCFAVFGTFSINADAKLDADQWFNVTGSGNYEYEEMWASLLWDLENAKAGTILEVDNEATLPGRVMQCFYDRPYAGLRMKFTYNNKDYSILIPAGQAQDGTLTWYGPLYLASIYGNELDSTSATPTTTSQAATATGVYTVSSGDTLSSIAKKLGTTAADLKAKNPAIKNANIIYVGQSINY